MGIRKFFGKIISCLAAACMITTPMMASPYTYNGVQYDTTDPAVGSGVMPGQETVTGAAGVTSAFYYVPDKHLLIIDGGATHRDLMTALESASTPSGSFNIDSVMHVIVTGDADLKGSVFANMSTMQTVRFEDGITFTDNTTGMFAYCTGLESVSAAGTLALPANINSMFAYCEDLTEIPQFNYSAVTSAKTAFYADSHLAELDLSTATNLSNDTNMLTHTVRLDKIKFGKVPSSTSGWTSRWWYDANNDGEVSADEPSATATKWMTTMTQFDAPYRKMSTSEQYTAAGLANKIYYAEDLAAENLHLLATPSNKLTGYCINYILDSPSNSFFSPATMSWDETTSTWVPGSTVPDSPGWESVLDPVGDHDGTIISRDLDNYEGDVSKALQTILFFGYPNDGAGMQEATDDATNRAYWAATQAVLWHALSGVSKEDALTTAGVNNEASQAAYGLILAKTYEDYSNAISGTVADAVLHLYIPDTSTVQNLISSGYSVSISKREITGTDELPGAQLTLSSGATPTAANTIATWRSGSKPCVINGLKAGQTYYLTETSAPTGYAVSEQISFVASGHNQQVVMRDDRAKHTITIKKVDDSETPARVAGAVITLTGTDAEGTVITTRTVTTTATADATFTDLYPGSYKISETTVPDGYEKADDILFTITATSTENDESLYTYTMVDKKIQEETKHTITVKKVDDAKEPVRVAGAVLTLTGKEEGGSEIKARTVTTTKTADAKFTDLLPGTYKISETTVPDGYTKAEDITVTIKEGDDDKKTHVYTMVDKIVGETKHTITVKKVDDAEKPARVAGAVLTLTGKEEGGSEIKARTVTTTKTADAKFTDLLPGTYKISETTVPDGYTKAEDITVTIKEGDDDEKTHVYTMVDKIIEETMHTIVIKKVDDSKVPERVAGAVLTLTGKDETTGKEIEPLTVKTTAKADAQFVNINPGTYTVSETTVPDGYEKAEDIKVVIKSTDTENMIHTYTMVDKKVEIKYGTVSITKTDITGKNELKGAVLTVSTGKKITEDNIVDTWTSTNKAHVVEDLIPGQTYYLTEETAPEGYLVAEQISFKATEKDQDITMKDEYAKHTITVKKVDDSDTPETVVGAVITLTGKDYSGKEIKARKATSKELDDITFKNLLPGTYILEETKVPSGYTKASKVKVVIKATDPEQDEENYTYTMVDKKIRYGSVSISKVDPKDKQLEDAKLKVTDSKGKEIKTFTTGDSATVIDGLIVGEKYKVEELEAPDGYEKAEKQEFTVVEDETVTVKIVDEYEKRKLIIKKHDENGNRVSGASITVTGKTAGDKTIDAISFTTSGDSDKELKLYPGTYKIEETAAPEGYQKAASVSVTISPSDDDKTVTLIDKSNKKELKKLRVVIKKVDDAGNRVEGATLSVSGKTSNGDTVSAVTFTTTAAGDKEVELYPGTYTLTETAVPNGYQKAADQTFTLGENESGKTLTMVDARTGESTLVIGGKTGDDAPIELLVGIIVAMLIATLGLGIFVKIRNKNKN